jgi:predicted ATP-dependent serine protease
MAAAQAAGGGELAGAAAKYAAIDWHEAWAAQPAEMQWLMPGFLEAGTVNALFAKPGTGKSLLALEIAADLARRGMTVVYLDDENRAGMPSCSPRRKAARSGMSTSATGCGSPPWPPRASAGSRRGSCGTQRLPGS